MKKGSYFFILDAFVGGTIIFFTLILLSNIRVVDPIIHTTSFTSSDYLQILASTEVRDFDNPYLTNLRLNGKIASPSKTLLEVITNLEAASEFTNSTELVGNITPGIIPAQTGLRFSIDGSEVYSIRTGSLANAQSVSTSKTIMIDSVSYDSHIIEIEAWV